MIDVFATAAEVQGFCQSQKWKFCFIGGLALQRWGEPRTTVDVDLTLLTGVEKEEKFIASLLEHFRPRRTDAIEFALLRRVLLLESKEKVGIDVALAATGFEKSMIKRASSFKFTPDVSLLTCSAEDLIVSKAFADRPKDRIDLEGIVVRQVDTLDWKYVSRQLRPLIEAKEAPEIMTRLNLLKSKIESEINQ